MSSSLPETITVFRGVGASSLHVGKENESMSWGNSEGATYVKKHNAAKTIPLSMWQNIIKSLEYSAKNPCAHTMNKTNVSIQQLREISDWESGQ